MSEGTPRGALDGILVADFSAYLPGPLATLMLARAGATVIKIERPEGEAARVDPAIFDLLNRGKRSVAIDLKRDGERLRPLLARADIVVEQFRPGVMDRLGLGHDAIRAFNPKVIHVSINGYGSTGPDAQRPGHDLTWQAESGLLSLNADANGDPVLPAAMAADIGGGSQAAFAHILLALYHRQRTGEGARIDVPMFDGLMAFLNEPIAHAAAGEAVHPGYSPATGSSPRYNLYRAADGRWLALASPEEKFWRAFCERTGLPHDADRATVSAKLAERPAAAWLAAFEGADLCCSLVATVEEALASPRVRRLLDADPLPLPVASGLGQDGGLSPAPALGEANDWLETLPPV